MVQIQLKFIIKIKNVLLLLTLPIVKMQEKHVMLKQVLFGKIFKLFLNRKFLSNIHQNLLFNYLILEFIIVEQFQQNNHSIQEVHVIVLHHHRNVVHVDHHQVLHQLVLEVDLIIHLHHLLVHVDIIHPIFHYHLI